VEQSQKALARSLRVGIIGDETVAEKAQKAPAHVV
jgi:hypothetical protein